MPYKNFKIAFFVDDFIGHFNGMAGVAERLIEAGHAIIFICPGKISSHIRKRNFPCIEASALSTQIFNSSEESELTKKDKKKLIRDQIRSISEFANSFIKNECPDLLIFDTFLLMYYPIFTKFKIPAASITTHPLLDSDTNVPPYTSDFIPHKGISSIVKVRFIYWRMKANYFLYRMRCSIRQTLKGYSHRSLMLSLANYADFDLNKEWNVRPLFYDMRFKSIPELILHATEIEFPRKDPVLSYGAYLGPCTRLKSPTNKQYYKKRSGPKIYVNLGTVNLQFGSKQFNFYLAILKVIRTLPDIQAVFAVPNPNTFSILKTKCTDIADRVAIYQWVEQGSCLKQANVIVSHGGSNSVKEAIMAGKPQLIMPHSADQPGLSGRVVYHQLGNRVLTPDPQDIKVKLQELLTEYIYKERVDKMRKTFIEYDKKNICVNILENIIEGNIPIIEDSFNYL
jgi:UDP:flavonoid glycosyltransferase YjiC (YdhE family)